VLLYNPLLILQHRCGLTCKMTGENPDLQQPLGTHNSAKPAPKPGTGRALGTVFVIGDGTQAAIKWHAFHEL
jgi:hypothetical protein